MSRGKKDVKQSEASAPVEKHEESFGEKIKHGLESVVEAVTGHSSEEEAPVEKKIKPVAGSDFEGHPKLNKFKKGN